MVKALCGTPSKGWSGMPSESRMHVPAFGSILLLLRNSGGKPFRIFLEWLYARRALARCRSEWIRKPARPIDNMARPNQVIA